MVFYSSSFPFFSLFNSSEEAVLGYAKGLECYKQLHVI